MEIKKDKCGQVAVDSSMGWILWIVIAAVAGFAFIKLISKFAG